MEDVVEKSEHAFKEGKDLNETSSKTFSLSDKSFFKHTLELEPSSAIKIINREEILNNAIPIHTSERSHVSKTVKEFTECTKGLEFPSANLAEVTQVNEDEIFGQNTKVSNNFDNDNNDNQNKHFKIHLKESRTKRKLRNASNFSPFYDDQNNKNKQLLNKNSNFSTQEQQGTDNITLKCLKRIIPLSKKYLIDEFTKTEKKCSQKEKDTLNCAASHSSRVLSIKQYLIFSNETFSILYNKLWNSLFPKLCLKTLRKMSQKVTQWNIVKSLKNLSSKFNKFKKERKQEVKAICQLRNRCLSQLIIIIIYCGLGAFIFKFTEGSFENFYKCGVKRVKRDFLDDLWRNSHNLKEEDWKSMARRKLMEFEEQLHDAHEAGVYSYSGKKSWTFLNSFMYSLTVISTIGYGHIAPTTTTGRAVTIVYAIFGIPMFLIILADFGKLFTRGMKFLWAFIRRLYYTGSCRKVRKTAPVQEVMRGVQLVYDLATFRRPSQMNPEEVEKMQKQSMETQNLKVLNDTITSRNEIASDPGTPVTPTISTFAIDDEFNLPISLAISILLGYIFVGATLYHLWEDEWSFFESFYFVFISMSTIGFGDYVPTHPIYMMCSIVYLVFGLALTSMCINVVQVMLSDQFKQASQKLGATIGLESNQDTGSIQPVLLQPVDVFDQCSSENENKNKETDSRQENNDK